MVQPQPQRPVTPVAVPPFWQVASLALAVHADTDKQLASSWPSAQLQPQELVTPAAVPPCWRGLIAPAVHEHAVYQFAPNSRWHSCITRARYTNELVHCIDGLTAAIEGITDSRRIKAGGSIKKQPNE